jgi:hypothetical protein
MKGSSAEESKFESQLEDIPEECKNNLASSHKKRTSRSQVDANIDSELWHGTHPAAHTVNGNMDKVDEEDKSNRAEF